MDVLLAVIADRWHWEMTTPSLCQPVKHTPGMQPALMGFTQEEKKTRC